MHFLEDLLLHDRNQLISQLADIPNGIDWLSRLYGVVMNHMDGPDFNDDGTIGLKLNGPQILEQLRPFCFYFRAITSTSNRNGNLSPKSDERAEHKLNAPQRMLLAAMLRKKFGGTFDDLRGVDVWSVPYPTTGTVDSRLKTLRQKIARFQYWFEISEKDETWRWARRPDKKTEEGK